MKVAIIGANGFIGSHLTRKLSQTAGVELFLFGKSPTSLFEKKFPYKTIDLTDEKQNLHDFQGIDLVYYLASESIPATTWQNPLIEIEKNLIPFLKFGEAIAKLNVKKIAFLSSAGTIYGATTSKVTEESDKHPFSPYGITKLTMENFLNYFKVKYGISYDIYRVSNAYGEGQDTSKGLGLINTLLEKIIIENRIKIFGDGQNLRNYIYVKDLAHLVSLSAASDLSKSGIYNVSSNDTLTINEIVHVLKKTVSQNFEVVYEEKRQSDNAAIDLDNSKILKEFPGFKFTSITQGISETYDAIKNKLNIHEEKK
jgi:UDP-glucose 4-epimerase